MLIRKLIGVVQENLDVQYLCHGMNDRPTYYTLISCSKESYESDHLVDDDHLVKPPALNPFWFGQTPVNQYFWQAIMGDNPSEFKGDQRPVDHVSWIDCVRFCNQLSKISGLENAYHIGDHEEILDVKWQEDSLGYRLPTDVE